ncbi:hypothetical protein I4U23_018167 [Adineta vaga]|nr:hypothetical protein I4U23_018167 [Adineta vaga]
MEWVSELINEIRNSCHEEMEQFRIGVKQIRNELKECHEGIDAANKVLKSCNESQVKALARLESVDNEMESCKTQMDLLNTQMDSCKAEMDSCKAEMDSCKAEMRSCKTGIDEHNAIIEEQKKKRQVLSQEMAAVDKRIEETKRKREQVDQYWKDVIKKETEKRSQINQKQCRKSSSKKPPRKRLNEKDRNVKTVITASSTETNTCPNAIKRENAISSGDA